jgi:hypothetical protein
MKSKTYQLQKSDSHFVSKTIKTTIAVFLIAVFSISCSKKEPQEVNNTPNKIVEENPLKGIIAAFGTDPNITVASLGDPRYVGYTFKTKVNGKISALQFKNPVNNGDVAIFDKLTKTLIKNEIITGKVSTENTKEIEPIQIEAYREYVIATIVTNAYKYEKKNGSVINFPISAGNVEIVNFIKSSGFPNGATMPTQTINTEFNGDMSFVFLPEK